MRPRFVPTSLTPSPFMSGHGKQRQALVRLYSRSAFLASRMTRRSTSGMNAAVVMTASLSLNPGCGFATMNGPEPLALLIVSVPSR